MSLSTKAVNEKLIDLTRKLQSIELLRSHRLVGGTNLALRFNHRLSIDIDLFCDTTPDIHLAKAIESEIKNLFQSKDVTVTSVKSIGVFLVIKGIKVDIVNYRMNWLNQSELVSGINVASLEDIIAMKLETITDRGSRKDFYDIHLFLNKGYSLEKMIEISEQKSGRELTTRILLSLNYFTSAENAEMINNQVISLENTTWNTVKSEISNVLVEYNKKLFLGDSDEN